MTLSAIINDLSLALMRDDELPENASAEQWRSAYSRLRLAAFVAVGEIDRLSDAGKERALVVAFLQSVAKDYQRGGQIDAVCATAVALLSQRIERGEHIKNTPRNPDLDP